MNQKLLDIIEKYDALELLAGEYITSHRKNPYTKYRKDGQLNRSHYWNRLAIELNEALGNVWVITDPKMTSWNWKEVTARKDYGCLCCGSRIAKGETYWRHSQFMVMGHNTEHYCNKCGPSVKEGKSYRETRIAAFGSPHLRGWLHPE